ncbi:MAG: Hsp20/alpha crystallin family protein [Pseudomonadota bacterium]
MTALRWTPRPIGSKSPWGEMDRFRRQIEGILESVAQGVESLVKGTAGVYPQLNLYEDPDNFCLTAELPGVASTDLELSVQGDSLTIRGERKIPETDEGVNYHRREREAGFFRRVVTLPDRVEAEKVKASLKNGLLQVTLPKAAEAKSRPIEVSAQED